MVRDNYPDVATRKTLHQLKMHVTARLYGSEHISVRFAGPSVSYLLKVSVDP